MADWEKEFEKYEKITSGQFISAYSIFKAAWDIQQKRIDNLTQELGSPISNIRELSERYIDISKKLDIVKGALEQYFLLVDKNEFYKIARDVYMRIK